MRAALLVALLAACGGVLPACYEGWEPPPDPGFGGPLPEPIPEIKPFAYLLLTTVHPSEATIQDDDCFPKVGIATFKSTEWSQRIATMSVALSALAETFVVEDVAIGVGDCQTLNAIQRSSISSTPWGTGAAPGDDALGRPAVHLVASLSEGEPALSPPAVVTSTKWRAWSQLVGRGINAVSLRYFVVSNPEGGYFTEWQQALGTGLAGTSIDEIDPTPEGLQNRASLIESDTQLLATWVLRQSL